MTVWIIARTLGFAALVLLTASLAIGAFVSSADRGPSHGRLVAQWVHRRLAVLGLAALGAHVGAILADSFAHVGVLGALVPLQSGYRPVAVALGTLAAYSVVLAAVTGALRGRLARSAPAAAGWRAIHVLTYAGWAAAMWHGFTAGTDAATGWAHVLYLACLGAVGGSLAVRLTAAARPDLLRRHVGAPPAVALSSAGRAR